MKRKSGRLIILLGLLLIVVVVGGYFLLTGLPEGTSLFGGAPPPPTAVPVIDVVVPRRDLPENTFLTSGELESSFEVVTRTMAMQEGLITSKSQIREMVNRERLVQGELLYRFQFVEAGLSFKLDPGLRAFPLEVDQFTGIVGEIRKYDYVDIILSGRVDEYFMQKFPLTLECPDPIQPECIRVGGTRPFPQTNIEPLTMLTVKTILEDIQVVKVITLTEPVQVQPGQPTPTPAAVPTMPRGWILILAVDEQQAEVLQFGKDEGWTTQLLLRAQEDHTRMTTTGITAWILLDPAGPYLMPIPQAIPHPVDEAELPEGIIPAYLAP